MSTEDLLGRIDERLKQVQADMHKIQEGFQNTSDKFENRFKDVDTQIHTNSVEIARNSMRFKILLAIMISLIITVSGLILQLIFNHK